MLTVTYINQDHFDVWHKTNVFSIDDNDYKSLIDCCNDNFGIDNVAAMKYRSERRWSSVKNGRASRLNHIIKLYFKNESDFGFFLLKFKGSSYAI